MIAENLESRDMSVVEYFDLEVEGQVWKQFIDEENQYLVVEGRNGDEHQVAFYIIDITKGEVINTIKPDDETWWLGIEDVQNGCILLHGYESEQSPVHKGVYCYDALTGQLLWEREDDYFYQKVDDKTIYLATSEQEFLKIETRSGEILETTAESLPLQTQEIKSIGYPLHYDKENSHFETLVKFLIQLQNIEPVNAIEYWESSQHIVISYYICDEENKLENYLLILSTEGEILFQDCIAESLEGVGLDTFFIYQEKLFFVQKKNKVVCIEL
ncbi:MAG: DUF4905 domain-containing protein [Cytophagales bacterium]|nr:DUF4905 domain-containing protein [Cytophagales bacterium]